MLGRAKKPLPQDDGLPFSKMRSRPAGRINKSELTIGEPERIRDRKYLDTAEHRACERCGSRVGVVGCHLNAEGHGGQGLKAGDDQVLFLCWSCHREMDTDPRGVPIWIFEELLRPALTKRYRGHLDGSTAFWTFGAPLAPSTLSRNAGQAA